MISLLENFKNLNKGFIHLLDTSISKDLYFPIDLSKDNQQLNNYDIQNPTQCQAYITTVLKKNRAEIAYGGYLEKRNLYNDKSAFSSSGASRDIHLGIDFWTSATTKVLVPIDGTVHSFQNNSTVGDYGPTIILKHEYPHFTFHTLYGHLSLESLENLSIGMFFKKGDTLATLGTSDINVNYAPHLHFQIVVDMEGKKGDYPGVCSSDMIDFYSKNCPDPNLLLQIYS